MSWKVALYDFIHARNQMEADYDWSALRGTVEDEAYMLRAESLQKRRRSIHRERGLTLVQSETRLRLRSVTADEGKVTAEIRLVRRLEARCLGSPLTEEREETERITLRPASSGKWVITAVAPATETDRGSFAGTVMGIEMAMDPDDSYSRLPAVRPSVPYLLQGRTDAPARRPRPRYDRELVRQYAERYWNSYNPQFLHFDVDCSNYVSQCMLAGGLRMDETGRRESGWWYKGRSGNRELWSFSWAVAHALQVYLGGKRSGGLQVEAVDSPQQLAVGDVICYCWEGDGRYGHSTIVTGFDPKGMPLVHAHTVNSRNRYWDYSDSYAWTERTKYRFFHIME